MRRPIKEKKPILFKVNSEGGISSLQLVTDSASKPQLVPDLISPRLDDALPLEEQALVLEEVVEDTELPQGIYLNCGGEMTGPFEEKELRRRWGYGVLGSDDQVWCQGMDDWMPLSAFFGVPSVMDDSQAPSSSIRFIDSESGRPLLMGNMNWGVVLPTTLSIFSMIAALIALFTARDQELTFMVFCALTLFFGVWSYLVSRKISLMVLALLTTFCPIALWLSLPKKSVDKAPVTQEQEEIFNITIGPEHTK